MQPRDPRSTVLTAVEEAIIVEFRRRTLLPLDGVLGCLCDSIPRLSRSALHRCLERHGISRPVPVYVSGTFEAMPRNRTIPRLRTIRVLIGPPLPPYEGPDNTACHQRLSDQLQDAIVALE
jgi:hypothetical protein